MTGLLVAFPDNGSWPCPPDNLPATLTPPMPCTFPPDPATAAAAINWWRKCNAVSKLLRLDAGGTAPCPKNPPFPKSRDVLAEELVEYQSDKLDKLDKEPSRLATLPNGPIEEGKGPEADRMLDPNVL